ncbi:subtilisin-like protease SBT2.5 [Cucurbita maxima]|uniref:Subtilisin-like protease SBT2.5 n=1 Tax=Cucurbita maxima TaxID=3661 RepID=A0A6J1J855_CUCMA|nr:subtilisin-like protease SBT2.5 [Cucurbita maxima]
MQENRYDGVGGGGGGACYFVFMNYDPEYERLRADRSGEGAHELDEYLSRKHDGVLGRCLEPGTYRKVSSFLIVDGFSVEITEEQADVLRSAEGVRVVEKNQDQAAPPINATAS